MTTSTAIAAELREIAEHVEQGRQGARQLGDIFHRVHALADALEAQQAAPADLTDWQRELMRLWTDPRTKRDAIESHAAQMVHRVEDLEQCCRYESDVAKQAVEEVKSLQSRCEAAEARVRHLKDADCVGRLVGDPPRYVPECVVLRERCEAAEKDVVIGLKALNEIVNGASAPRAGHIAASALAAIAAAKEQR